MTKEANSMAVGGTTSSADALPAIEEMRPLIKTVFDVHWALDGFVDLLSGEHTADVDQAQLACMLRPLAQQLTEAQEKLENLHAQVQRGIKGNERAAGENDRRLCALRHEFDHLTPVKGAGDDAVEAAVRRQDAIVEQMLDIPADSIIGVAAKLATTRDSRSEEPETSCDKLEYRAFAEIERLGGFGPQQQAAE